MTFLFPDRVEDCRGGHAFVSGIYDLPLGPARETAIRQQVELGNVPDFMRDAVEVSFEEAGHTVTFFASADYLCVGVEGDLVRTPLMPKTAQTIADSVGVVLPTTKMVDHIWKAASTRLKPEFLPPIVAMTGTPYFLRHSDLIEQQLSEVTEPHGLVAGHKKDIVVCKGLRPGRVAIYGWHQLDGTIVQPLNDVSHSDTYADYSHGVRLVGAHCVVDGQELLVAEVLQSAELAFLLSHEGPMSSVRY